MTPQSAIEFFGTQTRLAKALGLAQSTVAEWFQLGHIPEARQYQIELATHGKLRADKPACRLPECLNEEAA